MPKEQERVVLSEIMVAAGREALRLAANGFETHTKQDRSPVTSVDLAVDRMLRDRLSAAFPDDGWLSEETPDNRDRLNKKRVWIVDPIDGTRSFVRGKPEFCLSAALVENGSPIVAAIFNPATGEFFSAMRGRGVHIDWISGTVHQPFMATERPLVLVNPWELRVGRFRTIEPNLHCRPIGSIAYALALVSAGLADAAVTLEGGNEWDIAAGVLLIDESGGQVTNSSGRPFSFNQSDPRLQGTLALGSTLTEPSRTSLIQLGTSGSDTGTSPP